MRVNTVATLLLAGLLAACSGAGDDTGASMDDDAGMMQDSAQMDDAMGSDMMEQPAVDDGMDDAMDDGSMARDTSEMRRP
ncbi:MAG: hypothetical protein PVJ80_14620 [Gemmatimonadota bacterium]|jgi:hypothetical protein